MGTLLFGSLFRHLLGGVGAILLERGITGASEWEAISGGVMAAVAAALSYRNKKRLSK